MNDEGVTAILGLVLLHVGGEVRVPMSVITGDGLPPNSGVQVYQDDTTNELVIRITEFEDSE